MKDDVRLGGRTPEFARMSRNPGLGAFMVLDLAKRIESYAGLSERLEDVPSVVRLDGGFSFVGRYLRGVLREGLGRDKKTPESVLRQMEAELWPVLELARADKDDPSVGSKLRQLAEGRRASLVVREQIFKGRRGL